LIIKGLIGGRGHIGISRNSGFGFVQQFPMKQEIFQSLHQTEWTALEQWLATRARPSTQRRFSDADSHVDDLEFPAIYRRVCQHLALAERRSYSPLLIDYLQTLVQKSHWVLYRPPSPRWYRLLRFFSADFPQLVRRQWKAMTVSALLFFVPLIVMIGLLQIRPEWVHSFFSPEHLAQFESMYDPSGDVQKQARESESDLLMFGHYILNNVSIGFRTFASGLFAGIGSLFVLIMNGVMIGGVAGHLTAIGYGGPFWRFVAGHSAPELLGIVIAGGAGLQIGMAILAPGRRTRGRALIESGIIGAKLVLGVFAMLVFAAFVEAFWSSIHWIPAGLRFSVAGILWAGILLWLWRGGRDQVYVE